MDTSGGTRRPGIAFRLDGDLNQNRWAGYSSGSGGTALVFTYMVQAGDMDDDGIRLPANTIELFRGTIRDATDTIVDATLTYAQPGIQSGHKVDGSLTTTTNEDDGTDEDDGTTSPPTGTGGGGGGGGSSGPSLTVPGAPTNLMAVGGDGQVVLTWEAPASDGGTAITDYEVRINQTGEWISIGSTDTTHAVTGLVNGTAYAFQVRAVNAAGSSAPSNQTEATPELFTLDFAHFANGEGITSDLVFVNVATHPIRLGLDFYDKEGNPIAAETVVDATEDLEITEDGALSVRTAMEPLGELTISTHGQGEVVSGSVKVVSNGPIGGVLRFDLPGIGVAGVGASPPVRDALFPARREGGDQHRRRDSQHRRGSDSGELPLDERGRCTRRDGDFSGGQRAGSPVHRGDVHHDRYVQLRGVGALHRAGPVHWSGRGTRCQQPDLHHAAGGAGGESGGFSGIDATSAHIVQC